MDDQTVPFDLARMFLGQDPPLFYLEILARTLIVYLYTLVLMRWIGGRSIAQLSMVEFLLVIALGSAVGDPLFYPEVPVLHALLVITVIAVVNKGLDQLILRSETIKNAIDGGPVTVIDSGRILYSAVTRRDMGPAEFMAMLRLSGIRNLGEVELAYLESDGRMSVFRRPDPVAGLRIVPPQEIEPHRIIERAHRSDTVCCSFCGACADVAGDISAKPCSHCGTCRWTIASWPGQ